MNKKIHQFKLSSRHIEAIELIKQTNPTYSFQECLTLIIDIGCSVMLHSNTDEEIVPEDKYSIN